MKVCIRQKQRGAVVPLVAVLMVVFILCLALVVDLGHLHNVKVQMQRAVDAAALAGAHQLTGDENQDSNAVAVARAAAAGNRVENITDGSWVDGTSLAVELGTWDPDRTKENRFITPAAANKANAIKVRATLPVKHVFFFLTSATTVVTDAIAVNIYEETALPIALLSCVPINEGFSNTVCDVNLYKFGSDPEDTAGWTTLTYPLNAAQLQYFFTPEGNKVLNQVIYGDGSGTQGLEHEPVIRGDSSYDPSIPCGDRNVDQELNITCGLGPDFTVDPNPVDPLNYVQSLADGLPRWDTDAFSRIWSMDGFLMRGSGESDPAYEQRLIDLKAASDSNDYTNYNTSYDPDVPVYFQDGRFSVMIGPNPNGPGTIAYFDEALRYAGYPQIEAKNGQDTSVLQQFIDLSTEGSHFKDTLTDIYAPLDATASDDPHGSYAGGDTFAVSIPVIFAGLCGEWKSLKGKYYVGTANLLITRMWQNQNTCYDTISPLTVYGSPPCNVNAFSPKLSGDQFACVTGHGSGAEAGIEALITPKGEEGPQGIQKTYLVE